MKHKLYLIFLIVTQFIYSQVNSPNNPIPADGEADVYLSGLLTFASGSNINAPTDASYKIYLDTNTNPSTLLSTETLTSVEYFFGIDVDVNYSTLTENTNYYWKVEVLSPSGDVLATSPVWSFLTKTVVTGDGGTFNGDVHLTTQEEVNTFAANLYTSINGNLIIGIGTEPFNSEPNFSIVDLSSLSNLTSINGDLKLFQNYNLTSFQGFDNIMAIGGKFQIYIHPLITNLSALTSLMSIGGDFDIINLNIEDLSGLNNLASIGSNFSIAGNSSLSNLNGLDSLSFIFYGLFINDNDALIGLDELSALTNVGNIFIEDNLLLTNLAGLSNINSFNRNIGISLNDNITSLEGFNFHSSVGSLRITNNPNLINLEELSSLNNIDGHLNIHHNNTLTDLSGLDNVTNVSQGFGIGISNNLNLFNFCGLSNLMNNFTGDFLVSDNAYNPTQQDIIDGNCSTLGINDFILHEIKLFPNPTQNNITIKGLDNIISTSLYNIQGQKIDIELNENKINLQHVSSGIYFLNIKTTDGLITRKIIKQ